ncbi:hypothetical protein KFL_000190430 [Klebsormidium nitens]|uniref:F-box domain-containing protein n=1 Tax=Klebsormidium nitens TaxID=105231 RepID=A0A1Y1HJV4_KLENI|nr:hypothetical protein KFL_000190430 [Klebsormidium nitens]|eukprot:GAQ78825.1 hypothetical protein KFL_000190430 [Klebsormidium nitens]
MAGAGVAQADLCPWSVSPTRRRLLSQSTDDLGAQDVTSRPPADLGFGSQAEVAADRMSVDAGSAAGKLDENSLHAIFQHLLSPPDLKAAMGVCRDWRRVIVEGHSWRALCNRLVAPSGAPFCGGGVSGPAERLGKTPLGQWFLGLAPDLQEALLFQHLSGVLVERGDPLDGGATGPAAPDGARHLSDSIRSFLDGVRQLSNGAAPPPRNVQNPPDEVRDLLNAHNRLSDGASGVSDGVRRISDGARNLIVDAIAASTTDNYPEECISKTLKENARERTGNMLQACYWSSKGDTYANKDESLLYNLAGPMCVVRSFYVRPFKAFFQPKQPVYASAQVRFKLGYRKTPDNPTAMDVDGANATPKHGVWPDEAGNGRRRDKFREADYIWTYESPRYPMAQEDTLQRFDLPAPVLCSDGVLRVDLIGKVQRQEDYDNLYYTCITHVKAVGIALPCFRCRPAPKGDRVLEYCADAPVPPLPDAQLHANGFDAALFVAEFDSDDEEPDEGIWD